MLTTDRFTSAPFDLAQLRSQLEKLTDAELARFGSAARYMCSPAARFGGTPREEFVIQLREARDEWRRRRDARRLTPGVE